MHLRTFCTELIGRVFPLVVADVIDKLDRVDLQPRFTRLTNFVRRSLVSLALDSTRSGQVSFPSCREP